MVLMTDGAIVELGGLLKSIRRNVHAGSEWVSISNRICGFILSRVEASSYHGAFHMRIFDEID